MTGSGASGSIVSIGHGDRAQGISRSSHSRPASLSAAITSVRVRSGASFHEGDAEGRDRARHTNRVEHSDRRPHQRGVIRREHPGPEVAVPGAAA
jgi:hypothetical protein